MTSQVHFRMSEKEKKDFEIVLSRVGLTPGEAFRIFAKKSIEAGGIPFEVSQPNTRLKRLLEVKITLNLTILRKGWIG